MKNFCIIAHPVDQLGPSSKEHSDKHFSNTSQELIRNTVFRDSQIQESPFFHFSIYKGNGIKILFGQPVQGDDGKEGIIPLHFRTIHKYHIKVNIGVKLEPKSWDSMRQVVKKNHPGVIELNNWLTELRMLIQQEIRAALNKEKSMTSDDCKLIVRKHLGKEILKEENFDFLSRMDQYIQLRKTTLGYNSIKKIVTARNPTISGVNVNYTCHSLLKHDDHIKDYDLNIRKGGIFFSEVSL